MNEVSAVQTAKPFPHSAGERVQLTRRPHAAGQIKGRAVAGNTLHKAFNGLRLAQISLSLAKDLGSHEVAGAAPRKHEITRGSLHARKFRRSHLCRGFLAAHGLYGLRKRGCPFSLTRLPLHDCGKTGSARDRRGAALAGGLPLLGLAGGAYEKIGKRHVFLLSG